MNKSFGLDNTKKEVRKPIFIVVPEEKEITEKVKQKGF